MTAGTPWWQMTKTARQGFVLGTLLAVVGLYELLSGLFDDGHAWDLVLSAGLLALAGACLANAIAVRRRERSGPGADSQGTLTR